MNIDTLMQQFLKEHSDETIQIQIMERKQNGNGVFFVEFVDDGSKVDCAFIPFHSKNFPVKYLTMYRERVEYTKPSVLFYMFSYKDTEKCLEFDLDPRNDNSNNNINNNNTNITEVE